MTCLFQPSLARETADLLDGAEDRLCQPGSGNDDMARPVGQVADPSALAVSRIDIHDRLAERRPRQRECLEPEVFDFRLPGEMVGVETARDSELVAQTEVASQEVDEEPSHLRIRVRELELVSTLRAFGPV